MTPPLVKLSRKRARDKKMDYKRFKKKSSRIKAKLYKNWLKCKTNEAEVRYRNYAKIFRKLSCELSEAEYYKDICLTDIITLYGKFGET